MRAILALVLAWEPVSMGPNLEPESTGGFPGARMILEPGPMGAGLEARVMVASLVTFLKSLWRR